MNDQAGAYGPASSDRAVLGVSKSLLSGKNISVSNTDEKGLD